MAPATCNCYKIIPSCTTELEYIDCDGVTQYMLIEDGVTYNVCSQTQPIFDCIGGLVTNLGECVDGLCPENNCNCYQFTAPACASTLSYNDCNGELIEIPVDKDVSYNFCSSNTPVVDCEVQPVMNNLGECVDGICPELDCQCYEVTIPIDCDGKTLTYVDCDLNTVSFDVSGNQTYSFCSVIPPTINCKSQIDFNLKGGCVNGECPVPPVVCICNKVTNTTNETQTYCYIDCDSNQQSIILQPGESSNKICVSAWTECITCDCLEGTFSNVFGNDTLATFKIEKTDQIKNGKPIYETYIAYNNDYTLFIKFTLTFESDNCWYLFITGENVNTSLIYKLCQNVDCPIGDWEQIYCSCVNGNFTTPEIAQGLSLVMISIDENGYPIFNDENNNFEIIYNNSLVRWELIDLSNDSLVAYYVNTTESTCPYDGIFSPVSWVTIDPVNSFELDGVCGEIGTDLNIIKCEPKCDCINIDLVIDSGMGGNVNFNQVLTPTGNVVNGKTEYYIYFLNGEYTLIRWNSITNCWELIDDKSTVLATLCDSSDPSCPIGTWVSNTISLISITSDYCIESILPENIENFGDCIDGQCPTIPVTTTTTTFFPPPPVPLEPTNECDVITIFPMGVECFSINPSFTDTYDGSASLYITGGTPPYEILWENKSVGTTINNLGVGEYKATVTDSYGDFLINTTCVLSAETPSPTTTTSTTTLPQFGDLCVIYTTQNDKIPQSQFADFIFNGYFNGKPSWLSSDGNFFMYWNTGTTEEWLISGSTSFVVYNPNPETPPLNGWQILGAGKTTITVLEGSCDNLPPLQMQLAINNPSCGNNGSIIVTANGGIPPYFYSKDGGSTFQYNPIFNNLGSGNYSIVTKDSTGTLQTQIVTLTSSSLPTTYNLTLNRSGNNLSVSITPPLPNGVSVIFDLITNSQFNVAPLATSAVNNVGANILVNGSPITPNAPVINNTTTTNLCNGTTFITTTSLTWSNITLNNTSTFSGTLFNTISPVLPLPSCYTATSNTNVIINNPRIQGCECCNVVIIQEAQTRGNANSIFV